MLENLLVQMSCRTHLWNTRQILRLTQFLAYIRKDNEHLKACVRKHKPNGFNFSEIYNCVAYYCGERYAEKNKKFFDHFNQKFLDHISA